MDSDTDFCRIPSEGDSSAYSPIPSANEETEDAHDVQGRAISQIRSKLEMNRSEEAEELMCQAEIIENQSQGSHSESSIPQYYKAINLLQADPIIIVDALDAILSSRFKRISPAGESLPELERVLAGFHFCYGTEDTCYLELAAVVCNEASYTDKAEEYLPVYQRTINKLLKRTTKTGEAVLFTAMRYLNIHLITAHELRTISHDTMNCMQSNGQFWTAWNMWFELDYTCGGKAMFEEANYYLLQALEIASNRDDFFTARTNLPGWMFPKLFVHLPKGDWRESDRPAMHPKLLKLEEGLRVRQVAHGIDKQEATCWISVATLHAQIESQDAKRVLKIARAALQESPPFERHIWESDEPHHGLRFLWDCCVNRGYVELAEEAMVVILEAAARWQNSSNAADAESAFEIFRKDHNESQLD